MGVKYTTSNSIEALPWTIGSEIEVDDMGGTAVVTGYEFSSRTQGGYESYPLHWDGQQWLMIHPTDPSVGWIPAPDGVRIRPVTADPVL